MKKSSSKIREDIARLKEDLKAAETREADRIGRIALKAGLGEIDVDEDDLFAAFEDFVARFQRKEQRQPDESAAAPANIESRGSNIQRATTEAIETRAPADGAPET